MEIIETVRSSNNYTPDEDLASSEAFPIHETAGQRTWLVATRFRLYKITDDASRKGPSIEWSISRSRVFTGGKLALEVSTREEPGEAGIVDIGYRKNNPYSKHLFPEGDITQRVLDLVRRKMR